MAGAVTPERVMAEVERVMSRPFVWGHCDCCSAACDVFAALWGIDPMAGVRGYAGVRAALRLIRDQGGRLRQGAQLAPGPALRLIVDHGGLPALADQLAADAGLRAGHATGGLALSIDHRSLLVCISPGTWAGKSRDGFAILRAADRGWHA